MKLHLPTRLRKAVLACVATVATLAPSVATGVVVGGLAAWAFTAQQAMAAVPSDTATAASGDLLWSCIGGTINSNLSESTAVDNKLTIEENGTVTAETGQTGVKISSIGSTSTSGFTVSFTLSSIEKLDNWQNVLALGTHVGNSQQEAQLQKNGQGDLMIYATDFGGGSVSGEYNLGNANSLVGKTLTFTFDGNNLSAYVDGRLTQALKYNYAENVTPQTALSAMALGSNLAGNGRNACTISYDNIGVWDSAMTMGEAFAYAGSSEGVYSTTLTGTVVAGDTTWQSGENTVSFADLPLSTSGTVLSLSTGAEGATLVVDGGTSLPEMWVYSGDVTLQSQGEGLVSLNKLVIGSGNSFVLDGKAQIANVVAAGDFVISQNGELSASGNISSILIAATGTGTISLADGGTISAGTNSSFAGTIDVAAGKQLNYGNNQENALSLSSATVQLNEGSTLYVHAHGAQLGALDVQGNAKWWMEDSNGQSSPALTIGEVRIAAGKTLEGKTNWEGMITFENLNAEGDLSLVKGAYTDSVVNINAIEKSGNISIAGKNGVLTLGSDASSVLNLGGNVTAADEATIKIKGQLAGESTISGGTINVESTASVTGDITFGSDISLTGTLQNSGSLTLGGNVSVNGVEGLTTVENATVTYSSNEGKDGYIASSQYYVVQGTGSATSSLTGTSVLTSGGVEIGTITQSADGKSLVADVAIDAPGGIWYVNTQDFTIDGSETNLAKDATGYTVAAGKTLTIAANQNNTMTVGKIFSETTGAGNITLTTNVEVTSAAQVTGKLTVDGATLKINTGVNGGDNSYLGSFTSIDLNDAVIDYHGRNTTWQNVTVGADGAALSIEDMGEHPADVVDLITFAGTTTLNGNLNIASRNWKFGVNIEALTGTGDLSVISSPNNDPSEVCHVDVKLQETYTGTLSLTHNLGTATQLNVTADGDINLEGLNVSGGSRAQVDLSGVAGTKNLGAVSVGANTTLELQGTIGDMVATGDGTISLADGTAFTGTASIANGLTLAGTITNSGNLTLTGGLTASSLEVFDAAGESAISYANGDVEGNGYLNTALTIVQSAADSSQLTANGLTLTVAGAAYNLTQNGNDLQLIIAGDGGNYFVNNTQDYAAGTKIADAATTGIVMNGGTLNLNTALADGISISTAAAGSVINVADGVTLANSSVTAGSTKSTITGGKNAVFDLGTGLNGAMNSVVYNVNFGEQWEGITQITNSHIGENTLDNLRGGGKGTLKLVGLSGWLVRGQTVQADILLENYSNTVDGVTTTKSAFVFDDNSQDNYTFAGDISGSGDFQVASKSGSWAELNFTGSTENWTGGIVVTNAYKYTNDTEKNATNEVTINLTHGGNIFSAEGNNGIVMDRASTNDGTNIVNLNIGNADAASTMNGAISMGDNADDRSQLKLTVKGDTTFKNEVEVTSLTVDANKTATLEAATTTDALTTNGTIKVTGNGSLTYGGTTTVWAPYTGYNTEAAAATITSNAITGGSVTINNAEDVTESRVISDSAISKYGEGTANVAVGDANAAVWVEEGNLAMTAANGSTSLAEMTIAAGSQVSTTGNLTVTDALTIIGDAATTPALSVTGALTLAGAEINLTNLTLREGVTSYTLGTVTTGDIDTTGVSLKFGADQLAAAGFEGYTATVGASATDATALVLTLTAPEQPGEPDPGVTTLTEITITGGTYANDVLTFTTTADLTNTVFGDKLNATMSEEVWAEIVGATTLPEEVLVSFTDANGALIDFDANDDGTIDTVLTINGEGITGTPVVDGTPNSGTIVGNYVTAYIPEPTTTTLSLLALAGLAVRRRRK